MIVLDASVFNKLILDEPDSGQAQSLLEWIIGERVSFGAPNLLLYEAVSPTLRSGVPVGETWKLLGRLEAAGMRLMAPSLRCLEIAADISASGTDKSGHPAFYDAIYQALAIEQNGTLITADLRHCQKAESFGAMMMLARASKDPDQIKWSAA